MFFWYVLYVVHYIVQTSDISRAGSLGKPRRGGGRSGGLFFTFFFSFSSRDTRLLGHCRPPTRTPGRKHARGFVLWWKRTARVEYDSTCALQHLPLTLCKYGVCTSTYTSRGREREKERVDSLAAEDPRGVGWQVGQTGRGRVGGTWVLYCIVHVQVIGEERIGEGLHKSVAAL